MGGDGDRHDAGRHADESATVGPRDAVRRRVTAVWTAAGAVLLAGDMALHELVHAAPALEARPRLVMVAVLGLARILQLAPSTRRHLTDPERAESPSRHATRCLRADGPLMVVMFAVGGGLAWMGLLTALMAGERFPRIGPQVAVGEWARARGLGRGPRRVSPP